MPLTSHTYATPLGQMLALLSERGLCLLEFSQHTRGLGREIAQVEAARGGPAQAGAHALGEQLGRELAEYFAGRRRHFGIPLDLVGTPFQQSVWQALLQIPYGQTRSYAQQAQSIGRPTATRAVAAANGSNKIALIVPYRGAGPALNDALAGMVQVMPDQLPSSMPHIKSGKLLPMVIAADARSPDLPNVPTFKELGYNELNQLGISWFGMVLPKGTPDAIVTQVREAAIKAAHLPEVQAQLKKMGAAPTEMDQSKFAAQISAQTRANKLLLDKAGVKPE